MLGASLKKSASTDRLQALAAAAPPPQRAPPAAAGSAVAARHQRRLALRFKGCRWGLPVPSEMWGAAALAARMTQPSLQPQLQRAASAAFAQAFSAAAAEPPPEGPVSEDHPKALAEALEWRPRLSGSEDALCLLAPAALCAAVYALTAPASVRPLYGAAMALLYTLLVAAARALLLERRFAAVQRSERELAAADSRFFQLSGIQLHYKRRTPASKPPHLDSNGPPPNCGGDGAAAAARQRPGPPAAVLHCLHGFGASAFSWSFVQQGLADALHAVVTAHDMPGFGLTQRPRSSRFYTLHFNGEAALAILDAEAAAAAPAQREAPAPPTPALRGAALHSHPLPAGASSDDDCEAGEGAPASVRVAAPSAGEAAHVSPAPPPRRILIGHSMGGAAAAEAVVAAPEKVAALVLVAPAVVALWLGPPQDASDDPVASGLSVVEELVSAEDAPGETSAASPSRSPSSSNGSSNGSSPALSRSNSGAGGGGNGARRVRRVALAAAAVAKAALLTALRAVLAALSPLLVLLLRRLVRSRRFWERGLASAWHDGRRVNREYVDAYRSGQLVRGWEGGILRFLAARFGERAGILSAVQQALQGKGHLTQAEQLAAAVRRHGIPVLIVHGSSDALVPAANSRRLAALLPAAQLVEFEGCGHMPQEECPDRFVETVRGFVQGLG